MHFPLDRLRSSKLLRPQDCISSPIGAQNVLKCPQGTITYRQFSLALTL